MRYERVSLIELVEVGKDVLGNPVTERRVHPTRYRGELSGRSMVMEDLEGRDVTHKAPSIWTDMPPDMMRHADGIRIGEDDFRVLDVHAFLRGKWSAATLERWRQDANPD